MQPVVEYYGSFVLAFDKIDFKKIEIKKRLVFDNDILIVSVKELILFGW